MINRRTINLGKLTDTTAIPDLIDIQLKSYSWFLQRDAEPDRRDHHGLEAVFRETFPIESPNDDMVVEYVSYSLGEPRYSIQECKDRDASFSIPLKAIIRLINKETGEVREQTVYMGDLPVMTPQGTFIINGAERVVVSQLHRSPGIFFFYDQEKRVYSARIIPYRGSWLELELDTKGVLMARIDRKKKFPVTLLLKAMQMGKDQDILKLFYQIEKQRISGATSKELKKIIGRRLAGDLHNPESDEIIMYAGEKINEDSIDLIKEMKIKGIDLLIFPAGKDDTTIINCLEKDGVDTYEAALQKFHAIVRPGEPFNLENARAELERLFFSEKSYDLGGVGRYKINNKFSLHNQKDFEGNSRALRPVDIIEALKYFVSLVNDVPEYHFDDIDHLGNRRVRSVGELLMNQLKVGFTRMERVVRERMTVQDIDVITPQALISIKPIMAVINEFFGSSQLSQFMDQTNPLAELTHKRRLNALGPGGLSRERAGFEVRDVHYSHYGRMCPIETPEGPNIGLIVSMSSYCRVNEFGFLETPYRKVQNGKITGDVKYLTADLEERYNIAQANAAMEKDTFAGKIVSCRRRNQYPFVLPEEVHFMDMAPLQVVSVSTALIPFLEHDDANRALMGSNMQRQAVPLLVDEAPLVGTGMEHRAVYDSRVCVVSEHDGYVMKMDSRSIWIKPQGNKEPVEYKLIKYRKSNQSTCVNQRPQLVIYPAPARGKVLSIDDYGIIFQPQEGSVETFPLNLPGRSFEVLVKAGREVEEGELLAAQKVQAEKRDKQGNIVQEGTILADGSAVDRGKLALGRNVLVGFMPWEGYNFEDAILISERVVKEDIFTSIHIDEYEIQARETKLGQEIITRDIPNLSDKAFRDLDETGVVRVGAEVKSGDILVGMVTPKGESDLTPEYKLLHSIFGEKAREVRDTSLRMPNGAEGIVIDVKRYSRENGDELPAGVEEQVKVYVAKKRKLQVGDKMAGRHGNKGVVARIMAEEDMPFMEDGTALDLVLNPLGVPSRMNLGQILESMLGLAGFRLNVEFETPVFDGAPEPDLANYLKEAGLPTDCKFDLYDGRSGEKFENKVFCGMIYMLKLAHLVEDKIHARSTGPYSLVTQQPLGGKAQFGGQRLGEMEVWALEAYGASHTLQELLTVKSDDMLGRARIYEAIVKGVHAIKSGVPESFNVLMQELRGLALDVAIYNSQNERVELADLDEEQGRNRRNKIKLETIEHII